MQWPPRIGAPLPRAEDAWCTRAKLIDWVLGERGHAGEWKRVFHVEREDAELVWESIAEAVPKAPVTELRGREGAVTHAVLIELTIEDRTAPVLTAWHYAHEGAAPRLVTAYPKPYTRRNGDHG